MSSTIQTYGVCQINSREGVELDHYTEADEMPRPLRFEKATASLTPYAGTAISRMAACMTPVNNRQASVQADFNSGVKAGPKPAQASREKLHPQRQSAHTGRRC